MTTELKKRGFAVEKEGDNKLWIRTPFPVSHAVWNFFVKAIFPHFRNTRAVPPGRYINRFFGQYEGSLADGQEGYRVYAFMPDDERVGLQVSNIGYIQSSDDSAEYLHELSQAIPNAGDQFSYLLHHLEEKQKRTLNTLMGILTEKGLQAQSYDRLGTILNNSIKTSFGRELDFKTLPNQFKGDESINDLEDYLIFYFLKDLDKRLKSYEVKFDTEIPLGLGLAINQDTWTNYEHLLE